MLHPDEILDPVIDTVSSGSQLPAAVAEAINRLRSDDLVDDPFADVVIITPPDATANTLQHRLPLITHERGRGMSGIRFATPFALARHLVEAVDGPLQMVRPHLLAAAVRSVLATNCPDALTTTADHPATIDAIVSLTEDLRFVSLSDRRMANVLAGSTPGRQAVIEVADQARSMLRSAGYVSEADILARATEIVSSPDALPSGHRSVIVASTTFDPALVDFLSHYAAIGDTRVVMLGSWSDDRELAAQVTRIAKQAPPPSSAQRSAPISVTSCPDHDEEVRHVMRSIASLADKGVSLDRIALLLPTLDPYLRVVTDHLDRAGIGWSGVSPTTLAESLAGQVVRLALAARRQPDRRHLLDLLSLVPQRASANESHRDPARWRRLTQRIGLATEHDWESAHDALQRDQAERAERRQRQGLAPTTDADAADIDQLTALLDLVEVVRSHLDQITRATRWRTASRAAHDLLTLLIGGEQWRSARWADLPAWQRDAATTIMSSIDALAGLDAARLSVDYTPDAFERAIGDLLEHHANSRPPTAGGVQVRRVTDGVCLDADRIFVVGAIEGIFPPPRSGGLFTPAHRDSPAADVLAHSAWTSDQVRRAWASLAAGTAPIEVSWPRANLRQGGENFRSRLLPTTTSDHEVATHADGLHHGRALTVAEGAFAVARPWTRSPIIHRRAKALVSRTLTEPTSYDGMIGNAAADPSERVYAVTSLERLARCGVSYLYRQVLGVGEDEDDPAVVNEISPLTRGSLVHAVLYDLAASWLSQDPMSRPKWLGDDHLPDLRAAVAERVAVHERTLAEHRQLGHPIRWALERDLIITRIVNALEAERATGREPLAAEFSFGDAASSPHVIDTAAGPLALRGVIDRIDRVGDAAAVTDFKVISSSFAPNFVADDPTEGGAKLQLPLYAEVAATVFGGELGAPAYRYIGPSQVTDRVLPDSGHAHAHAALDVLADRLVRGDFRPGQPDPTWGCPDCCPDGLGRTEVTTRVQRFVTSEDGAPS
ncbi:MAG: hypothetical protein CSA55_03795 [Ilumatobacter coccineus]|uniref:PD-(D/E)XK endonuclease-like domain-containing protein n=1 Tax=Ilumatobacter coccineus TaxID=467094 RepID=A0A2G6K9H0_9ACTN|nr:MAG: hypothetical protein CSA55_03795 [Ilumatobacter coccineus]